MLILKDGRSSGPVGQHEKVLMYMLRSIHLLCLHSKADSYIDFDPFLKIVLWVLALSPGALRDWSRLVPLGFLGLGSTALAGEACPRILRSKGKFASLALPLGMSPHHMAVASCSQEHGSSSRSRQVSGCSFMVHL